ncbi:halocyanin domain-containing protein (plasmid) [Haloferacaceae archaeon DSL9]
MRESLDRRTFVRVAGGASIAMLLAGCTNDADSGDDGDTGNGAGSGDENGGNGDDSGDEDAGSGGGGNFLDDEPDYGGWFDDVDNYEGTVDMTGQDTVDVQVGSEGGLRYTPAAVAVSPGTTVVWEWTGEGGGHNVSEQDGAFESEISSDAGVTFEHTFDEEGVYQYVCTPHEATGMKGAVVVQ